jgi:hypothetical protein
VVLLHGGFIGEALPLGQFAVVPGTGHGAPIQKPELVNRMILDFLSRPGGARASRPGGARIPAGRGAHPGQVRCACWPWARYTTYRRSSATWRK